MSRFWRLNRERPNIKLGSGKCKKPKFGIYHHQITFIDQQGLSLNRKQDETGFQQHLNKGKMLKIVFAVMCMSFLFISSSNINSQFIDRASNLVYAQVRQVPLQEMTCSDGTAPDVTTGLCADGSQPQGQVPENVSGAAGGVARTTISL